MPPRGRPTPDEIWANGPGCIYDWLDGNPCPKEAAGEWVFDGIEPVSGAPNRATSTRSLSGEQDHIRSIKALDHRGIRVARMHVCGRRINKKPTCP